MGAHQTITIVTTRKRTRTTKYVKKNERHAEKSDMFNVHTVGGGLNDD